MHRYYDICPVCGANLDPGEKCDCERKEEEYERIRSIINDINIPGISDNIGSWDQVTDPWSDI